MPTLRERLRGPMHRTAFVLSGGGNLGAVQVGMLRALLEAEIRPDLVVGCSVGALNGAGVSQDPTTRGIRVLERLWQRIDGRAVMPSGWIPQAVQLARRGEAIHGNEGLASVIEDALTVERFEDLPVEFQCVATDVLAVEERWFHSGPLLKPILASAALPAVYPAVEIDGVAYLDGAIINDVPISRALALGATEIYVLGVGHFDRPRPEPKRPIDVAVHAYWIARHHRFKRDLAAVPESVEVHLLPAGGPETTRFDDFTRSGTLIEGAYDASVEFLATRSRVAAPVE